MSSQITTAFVQQYKSNVDILAQQKGSRLRACVRVESGVTGQKAFFDQISATAAVKRTSRHGDTPLVTTPHARRMVTMADYDWADLVDSLDVLKTLADPTSKYALNAAYAFGRAMDDAIIAAALGTAYTGAEGSTSTSWPSATHQIAHASGGLTVAKVLEAKEILDENEVDPEIPRFAIVSAAAITDLLNTTEVKSADYNTVKALAAGQMDTFCGFKFVQSQRIGLASSVRSNLFFSRDSILLAIGQDIKTDIGPRRDKNMANQVYVNMSIGSTRMDETGVVEVQSYET